MSQKEIKDLRGTVDWVRSEGLLLEIDVNKWVLAIRHTPLETEMTIGSGQSVVVGKYFNGGTHVGYNRMNFRWGDVGTFQAAPGSHMWQIQVEHYREPEGIPISMCFGIPPAANLMAGSGFDYVILPKGCDELGVAGAIFELCERLQPGLIQDVHIPYCFTDWGGCIIQVKKRSQIEEGWQRNFLAAIMSCNQRMRMAIVVDTDIDIYGMDDVMWVLVTRVNPQTDILRPVPGGIGQTFMRRTHDRRGQALDGLQHHI